MKLTRRKIFVLVAAIACSGMAATALMIGGTAGTVIAVGVVLCYLIGLLGLEVLRLRRLQTEFVRHTAMDETEPLLRNVRSRHIELAARVDEHIANTRAFEKRLEQALDSVCERFERSTGRLSHSLQRHFEEETRKTTVRIGEAETKLHRLGERSRETIRAESRNQYTKVQALLALYHDIEPERALPPMHGWAAGVDLAHYLYTLVAEQGRSRVLECGSGTTTVLLAYAASRLGKGRIVSLEHDPRFADTTRRLLRERSLENWAEVINAPLVDVRLAGETWRWYAPEAIPAGELDLLLVDGPPGNTGPQARYPALPLLADRLVQDALVVLDDAFRPEEKATAERWAAEFEHFEAERLGHERGTVVLRKTR